MYDVTEAAVEKKIDDNRAPSEMKPRATRLRRIALIGNFPPRRCGIATFTCDLRSAITGADDALKCDVVAMTDPDSEYDFGDAVTHVIRQNVAEDYAEAARSLNEEGVELVCVQHEYGIFGGDAGEHLLAFLRELNCPVVTTLHTILNRPNPDQMRVMNEIIRRSGRIVVMSEKGRDILMRVHNAPARKIEIIPHGAPDFPFVDTDTFKKQFGFEGRDVLLTFGLLSPNKGLENVIRALPRIVKQRPQALYVILGATHPALVARDGEKYRESLAALAAELGVADNVRFVNTYVEMEDLLAYLAAADVYVTPYLNEAQITSGTLSYAVALGRAIVSTPYWHAAELFADGAGVLTPFGDSEAMGAAIAKLLVNPAARQALRTRAYAKGREMIWPRAAQRYLRCFEAARGEGKLRPQRRIGIPAPNLGAVERMTDQCGMLQHARFAVPDRNHGYCVDDNARALMLMRRAHAAGLPARQTERLANVYAAFVDYAWNEDAGCFRNFMGFDRRWLEERGSQDSCARSFWAICDTAAHAPDDELRHWARALALRVLPHVESWRPMRSRAFVTLGLAALGEALPERRGDLNAALERSVAPLLDRLSAAFRPGWVWCEATLAYDNHRLPQALLAAFDTLRKPDYKQAALEMLGWLNALHRAPSGVFRPVGSETFERGPYEKPAHYDQQPLEAAAAIDANWAAYDATGEAQWIEEAHRAYAWYLGENDAGARMATHGGGCYDGISPRGINMNQGAESILAFQYATCVMRTRERMRSASSGF
ncbi:MAG: glycosyltransferase family 4 protein [Pseudomonadota bacterium]